MPLFQGTDEKNKTGSRVYKRFFYRLVLTGCVCMLVPVLVIGLIYYRDATEGRRAALLAMHETNLQLLQKGLENSLHTVEVESLRLAYDPLVADAFSTPGYEARYWDHMKVLERFAAQCHLNPFLYDIVFYSAKHGFLLSHRDGYLPPERYREIGNIQAAMAATDKAQWVNWPVDGAPHGIAFVRKLPVLRAQSSDGLLIYVVHQDTLREALSPVGRSVEEVLVFSQPDTVLINADASDLPVYRAAGSAAYDRADERGMFRISGEDGELQALYSRSERGYMYVILFAIAQLDGPVRQMGAYIALVMLFVVALGVALIFVTSHYEYDPIRKLMRLGIGARKYPPPTEQAKDEFAYIQHCWAYLDEKADSLAERIEHLEPEVKDAFFSRLLRDEDYPRMAGADGRFGDIWLEGGVTVLLFSIRHLSEHAHFTANDRTLLTFAVRNVLLERLEQAEGLAGHALRADDMGIAMVLQASGDRDAARMIEAFALEAQTYLEQSLRVGVSVGQGQTYPALRYARASYLEAAQALSYRALDETTGVFSHAEARGAGTNAVMFYPMEEETRLVGALEAGQTSHAFKLLDEFHQKLRQSQSLEFLLQCYHILFASVARSFVARSGNLADFLGGGLMEQMQRLRDPADLRRWFETTVPARYTLYLAEDAGFGTKQAVIRICGHIRENIRSDLSLTDCAALVGMNPTHISAAFREETGMTFTEYVHGCQVEEIKRLLLTTGLRLSDIAETLGLSERSLNRIFLKQTGVTPGQYRREHLDKR